jgi:hypothetical protein
MKKLMVTGFPHCGTTILKSVIGHCDNVKELVHETAIIREEDMNSDHEFILCKWPWARENTFRDKKFNDYIKIFIIRNPLWIYSSLNKRCDNAWDKGIPKCHGIDVYIEFLERWVSLVGSGRKDVFLLKYENIFGGGFAILRHVFSEIGLSVTNEIFENNKWTNFSHKNQTTDMISEKPPNLSGYKWANVNHNQYRLWQINQPIQNMNTMDKLDYLFPEQIEQIISSKIIMQMYPDIPNILREAKIDFDVSKVAQVD